MYGGQASLGRACADLFQQARLNTDCKINFPGWVGVGVGGGGEGGGVGKAENIATQPSLAGAWAELGNMTNIHAFRVKSFFFCSKSSKQPVG